LIIELLDYWIIKLLGSSFGEWRMENGRRRMENKN
jgi:hypothetical protein